MDFIWWEQHTLAEKSDCFKLAYNSFINTYRYGFVKSDIVFIGLCYAVENSTLVFIGFFFVTL